MGVFCGREKWLGKIFSKQSTKDIWMGLGGSGCNKLKSRVGVSMARYKIYKVEVLESGQLRVPCSGYPS